MKRHHKKRAWNMSNPLYRYLHRGKTKTIKTRTRSESMARRKHRSGHRSSSGGMSVIDVALAGAIYGIARPTLANAIPNLFDLGFMDSDNAIIGTAGYFAMQHGKGVVKALGTLALGGEVASVSSKLAGSVTGGATTSGITFY